MRIQVKVRDISFDQFAAEHRMIANENFREPWEHLRGKTVTINTPDLGPAESCGINGRVWVVDGLFCRSLCEHQLEIGD